LQGDALVLKRLDDEQVDQFCDRRTQPVLPVPEPPEMVAGTGVEPAIPAL
jgi:hypothetical protein